MFALKPHKKPAPSSPSISSKENYVKQMISFIENKSDTSRRSVLQIFELMTQIDLTKISISSIKNPTLLYLKTLNEIMSRINKHKIVYRVTTVVLCAQMIAETARIFNKSSGIDISIFNVLLSEEKIKLPPETEISPFPIRKIQKLNSYSPLVAFLIKHYPQAANITDVFCYALVTMFERMKLKQLIPMCIPQFSSEKYTLVPHQKFDCAEIMPESLLEIANKLKSPIDPVLVLLVRFVSCKIFGSYDFGYIQINDLVETIFEFIEDDPIFNIDSLTTLLIYYSSNRQVNYPIHLTYTSVNHCLFFICLGLKNLLEPTTNDILLSTISFENAPCPSLALVLDHNLTAPFISEFISHVLSINNLAPEWNEEIKYLLQYVKLPPKREDLVEQSKGNNIDAIKILLKDPECLPLLKPDEYKSHKLLSLFLKPIELPLPEKLDFGRYGAAFTYLLRSLKDQPDKQTICNYMQQAAEMLSKITLNAFHDSLLLYHSIYSGVQPLQSASDISAPPLVPPSSINKISGADFFFTEPGASEFENISIIIDNLISLIYSWRTQFDLLNDKNLIQITADFNHHYYLVLNHSDRCKKIFGEEYKKVYENQPYEHFISAFNEEASKEKRTEIITLFRPVISSPASHTVILNFIKKCYEFKDEESFAKIIKIVPNITSIDLSIISNEVLFDILRILINSEITKNVIIISTKLIENDFSNQVFKLFLSASFDHPIVMTSICHNLTNVAGYADYFFNNLLSVLPEQISSDFSELILYLSRFIEPSEYEIPKYPKLKPIDIAWEEDKPGSQKNLKNKNNETKDRTQLGDEISISVERESNKKKKTKKTRKLRFNDSDVDDDDDVIVDEDEIFEEEEEEEEDSDDIFDNSVTITNSSANNQKYEFPLSTKSSPSIWEVPNLKHCTYLDTDRNYVDQPFFRCLTCNFRSNEGVCEYCAIHCHKGHQIYFESTQSCFCDCFEDPSRCVSNPDHKNFAHGSSHNHASKPKGVSRTTTYGFSNKTSVPNSSGNQRDIRSSSAEAAVFKYSNSTNNGARDSNNDSNNYSKISLSSKCIIELFLKLARAKFVTFEMDDLNTLQLKQVKSIKALNQFIMSPNFSLNSLTSSSQFRKRISRVKNLSTLLERRSLSKSISLICNSGNDIICYTNGSILFASNLPQRAFQKAASYGQFKSGPSSSSMPVSSIQFDECIYSIVSSGDSLIACLCDSVIRVIKITNELDSADYQQQQQQQQQQLQQQIQSTQQQVEQLQQISNPSPVQLQQVQILTRMQRLRLQIQSQQNQMQNSEIQNILSQMSQLQIQIQQCGESNIPIPPQHMQRLQQIQIRMQQLQGQSNQCRIKFETIAILNSQHQASPSKSAASASSSSTSTASTSISRPQVVFIDAIFISNSVIAVLTASSLTTFSLPEASQISHMRAMNKIAFTSMTLFKYKEKLHILAGNAEGQLAIYLITENGQLSLDHLVGIDRPNASVVVSSSIDDDLIFISSDKHPLAICRPSSLFSASVSFVQVEQITTAVTLTNRCQLLNEKTGKNSTVFFFTKSRNGTVVSLEFVPSSFVVSTVNDEVSMRPDGSLQMSLLGSFVTKEDKSSLFIYLPDGYIQKVTINEERGKMLMSHSSSDFPFASEILPPAAAPSSSSSLLSSGQQEYSVPVTFWSRTIQNSRDIVRLYANEVDEVSSLMEGRNMNVPPSVTLRFTARPQSSDYTIVGVRIFSLISSSSSSSSSANSRMVELNGRAYNLGGSLPCCMALKPSEVHPGAPITFTIMPGSGMMILRNINIHCMRTSELTLPRSSALLSSGEGDFKSIFDWMTESVDVFDFCTASLLNVKKDDEKSQIELRLAVGFSDDGTIDEEEIQKVLVVMYEVEEVALQARLIVAKLKLDHDVLQKIWAKAIAEVAQKKTVHKSQVNALWRDFTLLDEKAKSEIQNIVWNNVQEQSGLQCLLSAFY